MFGWGYDFDAYGYGYVESDGHNDYDDCYVSRRSDSYVSRRRESTKDGFRRFEHYAQGLLAELAIQRKTGEFLDVVVQVEGREFPCHRAVLATTPYFKAMLSSNFTESSSKVVHLRGIDSISFSKILDFLYSGKIRIGKDDVQDILQTARMLQFDTILQYCWEFIQDNLCPANCLGVMRLADMYGLSLLKKSARNMAVSNFSDVTQGEEFLSLTLSVQELLDLLGDEDLKVTNGDDVVTSVIRWLDHCVPAENRQTAIQSVLQKLKSHPVIRESAECLAKITAARDKHLLGISDNMAIIIGGWKAFKKTHPIYDEHPIIVQPAPLQSIICLDPDSQQYYHVTTLPTSVSGYMSVASTEGYLYVTGGRVQPLVGHGPHTVPSRQAFRYDFSSDTWLRLPDMPAGRADHQSVVVDGKLFLVGGDTLVTMDCYDPEEGAWIKVHLSPTIDSSSDFTVAAFRDKVVFIQVSESADDHPIDVQLGVAMHYGLRMGYTIPTRNRHKLCVHAFDVKTKGWTYADVSLNTTSEEVDIVATAVDDKLHIRNRRSPRRYSALYIFDAEKETLTEGENMQDFKDYLHAKSENSYRYMNGQKGIVDTIINYDFGDRYNPKLTTTPLPFALFGHSFLETKKSCVGWYCRDLATLQNENSDTDCGSA
ncbi:kelch-like protein 24 [Branchiostoma floridae]|uniref:Kelch-like protein 24 n=1 Tax=Branchiostoma floridae TaxID=7739 RepID=A0A9J7LYR5_BRAFL|nr:kelch-like protein 24 [Branchiostoma floridae]